jgi:hypothetical protein
MSLDSTNENKSTGMTTGGICFHKISPPAIDVRQGHEGRYRGQDSKGHRNRDLFRPKDRSFKRIHSSPVTSRKTFSPVTIASSTYYSEYDDEPKKTHHISGDGIDLKEWKIHRHHQNTACKADRNALEQPTAQPAGAGTSRELKKPERTPEATNSASVPSRPRIDSELSFQA